jgi:6-phosphogluconolactonase
MVDPIKPLVKVFATIDDLNHGVALAIAGSAKQAISQRGRFTLVLSGGRTPRSLYEIIAREYRDVIEWQSVQIYWGDERYVPPESPRSNYNMARESLLSQVPIPDENVYPMPTGYANIEDAARSYENLLRSHFKDTWPQFELILLGLGPDGHTASLFPKSRAVLEQERWVMPVQDVIVSEPRLTLTLSSINHARSVYFIAAGLEKAEALKAATEGQPDFDHCPASVVRPVSGELIWWVDSQAARQLDRKSSIV